jgi:hypothetical protein
LLYNLMLSELRGSDALIDRYRLALTEWVGLLDSRAEQLSAWSRNEFWALLAGAGAQVSVPTRSFVDSWLDLALSGAASTIVDSRAARQLIHARERLLKRGLARLDNRRSLEQWGEASGTGSVSNPAVTDESHVSVTFHGNPGARQFKWVERQPGSGFTVHCTSRIGSSRPAVQISYLIVEPSGF